MALTSDLISKFVEVTRDTENVKKETIVYGTIFKQAGSTFVQLDGSDLLTPVTSTTVIKDGDRVTVMIKNHTAVVTGNITNPSAQDSDVKDVVDKITEFEIVIADKVSADELEVEKGRIDDLVADNVVIKDELKASKAEIDEITADNVVINEKLSANEAEITKLQTEKIDAEFADLRYATIENLDATNADINNLEATYGEFRDLTTDKFEATDAAISNLEAEKLSVTEADLKYANIDFSNIGQAAMEYFYANSGLIKDVVIGDGTITGNLVGVTISGDLIEGNTIVADKLVIKGSDGLYYKLNTDGMTTEAEQTDYNSLNGQVIKAKSITATKISVDDLVAFDATIGGFNITEDSIYSGVKSSIDNTTRGIYLDKTGQIAIGDSNNFIKYFKDSDGNYKLSISAKSIEMSTSSKNLEDTLEELKDNVSTVLRIESSRGTVFKNNEVSTVLSAVIYRGSKRITDMIALRQEMGLSARLEWSWQRMDEDTFGTIVSTDERIGNEGFTFTLSPEDVDTKITFMCQLITD